MRKTLIFDLDGTLLDTLSDLHNSVNFALRMHKFVENSLEDTRKFVGNGLKILIKRSLPDNAADETVEAVLSEMKRHYAQHSHDETKPYSGVPELIMQLEKEHFQIAVVSNKADSILQKVIPYYFGNQIPVVIGESFAMKRKPAPDMVLEALHRLDASPKDAVYIGDSEVDLQTAENAGIPCISVSWGFRSKTLLEEAGARKICASPAELLRYLIVDCPCKRKQCPRHGNCEACNAHHHSDKASIKQTWCERLKNKAK